MILKNKHRKLEAALLALGAPAAMATTASADAVNGAALTAPAAVTLQPGSTTSLGKAMASGIPENASGAQITSDADTVLKVVNGKVTAPAGTYTVTWTLTYNEKGTKVTKTATQKVTVVKSASSTASNASSTASNASSTASKASSTVSSSASKASSAVSNASSADSKASNASDASKTEEYTTVSVDPDEFLTKYLEAATAKGVTGTINAHITGGMKKDAVGNPVSTVSVDENGKITVTDADKAKLAGTMTITLSNGNVLTSVISGGAMTTAVTTGDNILDSNASSAVSSADSSMASSADSLASSAASDVSSSAVLEPVSSAASDASSVATIDNVDPAVSSAASNASGASSASSSASKASSAGSHASSSASNASSAAAPAYTAAGQTGSMSAKTLPQTGEDHDSYVLAALGILDTVFLAGIAANIKKRKAEE